MTKWKGQLRNQHWKIFCAGVLVHGCFLFLFHGGSATTENAIPVRRWLFELVTHIFARWWCTVPLSCVNSQHLNSPPSLTAVASPHAIPTNTNEHCCLLKIHVEFMIRANSLASHSLAPSSQRKETVGVWYVEAGRSNFALFKNSTGSASVRGVCNHHMFNGF